MPPDLDPRPSDPGTPERGRPRAHRTVARATRHQPAPIAGSRFVADVAPAEDEQAARALLERVRAEFDDATHHVFAWRLPPDGALHRWSDDGEPSGSAGQPVLRRLEGAGLVGVVAVVTRWFGGTRLGIGGLVRAYGGAVAGALERAGAVEVVPTAAWVLRYPYGCEARVQALLAAEGWEVLGADYGAEVELRLAVAVGDEQRFAALVADATAGRARVSPLACS